MSLPIINFAPDATCSAMASQCIGSEPNEFCDGLMGSAYAGFGICASDQCMATLPCACVNSFPDAPHTTNACQPSVAYIPTYQAQYAAHAPSITYCEDLQASYGAGNIFIDNKQLQYCNALTNTVADTGLTIGFIFLALLVMFVAAMLIISVGWVSAEKRERKTDALASTSVA